MPSTTIKTNQPYDYNSVDIIYAPSSGVMVRVKLRRSVGSGKFVFIVDGRSSSVKSIQYVKMTFVNED
jgi:hypothetical protein